MFARAVLEMTEHSCRRILVSYLQDIESHRSVNFPLHLWLTLFPFGTYLQRIICSNTSMPLVEDMNTLQSVDYPKFDDDRGSFIPTPIDDVWIQENISFSNKGVLRGLHLQAGSSAQSKLVRVLVGKAIDVVVDIRPDSPTFKEVSAFLLEPEHPRYVHVPRGFAHGFLALEDNTLFQYRVDNIYDPEAEKIVHWHSVKDEFMKVAEEYGIAEADLIVHEKDASAPMLEDFLKEGIPVL